MSVAFALTLAAISTVQPHCSWDRPGVNPYTGSAAAALERYSDIPAEIRAELKRRIEQGQADDKVSIKRDSIGGKYAYEPAIRDMHFGRASVCRSVTRAKWSAERDEPGVVYCAKQHCILVPKICGNFSRVTRRAAPLAATVVIPPAPVARELGDGVKAKDLGLADAEPQEELTEEELQQLRERAPRLGAGGPLDTDPELVALGADEEGLRWINRGRNPFDPVGDHEFIPSAVPEAQTWAMLLAGLGLLGWAKRRAAKRA
ncbi:MHFG family PEP-CTERM protein [Rugamonas rubra]|uniref:PEP-CTERM protein-sorting domain-containing protein n=1 Tax=Rugamonas rubra TaxID=758825 RepID=A0A1I4IPW8_9BURK|nr:MHFG family PEP-CTERM protein [Rugamonas rubra]SFL55881.1 PEP-CTERM protein-sorting domain-containing protein [Rugamonas rubra]